MRVLLVLEAERLRAWMRDFARDLIDRGVDLRLHLVTGDQPSLVVRTVLLLDDLLWRRGGGGGGPVVAADLAPFAEPGFVPDLVVDLTAAPTGHGAQPVFALAFDGAPGEDALLAPLTRCRGVVVEVFDAATGEVLERARPSLERAAGPIQAAAVIGARAATLLTARLVALAEGRERPRLPSSEPPVARGVPRSPSLRFLPRALVGGPVRRLYHLLCRSPHWRVGWRFVDGPGLVDTGDFSGPPFRPIPDDGLHCYADPFPISWNGELHVFVEDFDHRLGKGGISAIRFDDTGPVGEPVPVLVEPWHLSFPYPIVDGGELYMVPESTGHRDVALYRCVAFPDRWERVATLLADVSASDVSIFRHGDRWWMFSTLEDGHGGWSDMLAIHSAPALRGPWTPHRDLPVLIDAAHARPAGRPFVRDGRLFRPVQDCSGIYGGGVDVVEVTRLDGEGYEQVVRRSLRPNGFWPGRRLHTVNRCGRLELIDGAVIRPKWDPLDRLIAPLYRPRGSA